MSAADIRKVQQLKHKMKRAEGELLDAVRVLAKSNDRRVLSVVINTCDRITQKLDRIHNAAAARKVKLHNKD